VLDSARASSRMSSTEMPFLSKSVSDCFSRIYSKSID